jgi:hypothetical protein
MGRTRLREIAKRMSDGRRLGLKRVGPRIAEFSEEIRAIEGEPFRVYPSHNQLQCAEGQARRDNFPRTKIDRSVLKIPRGWRKSRGQTATTVRFPLFRKPCASDDLGQSPAQREEKQLGSAPENLTFPGNALTADDYNKVRIVSERCRCLRNRHDIAPGQHNAN